MTNPSPPDSPTCLPAALAFLARGLVPLPITPGQKRPRVDWKRWQTERPTEAQVREWWARWPEAQVGVVTGRISGLVVLDCDTAEALETVTARCGGVLPSTPMVKTPRGWHLYFRHPGGEAIPTRALALKLDCKADGGCVVAPPSVNGSGQCYAWQIGLDVPLAPVPGWVREGMAVFPELFSLPARIPDGERNSDLHRLARSLHAKGLTEDEIRAALESVNQSRCVPPLPVAEVAEIAAKAGRQPDRTDFAAWKEAPRMDSPPVAEEETAPVLTVPSECLIGVGRDFADLYARYLEPPRSFFYFSFLTYFGAAVSGKITLASELAPDPRLYTVVIGESADDRKSTALVKTDEFFRSLAPEWAVPVLYGVGSAEGIAEELTTGGRLILHFDELKAFIEKTKIEHSVMLPMVSTLFERYDYDNRTRRSRIQVRGGRLALIAASTRDTYSTLFDRQFHDIGFLNRLLIVVDRSVPRYHLPGVVPAGEIESVRVQTRERLRAIEAAYQANGRQPLAYPLTPTADAIFAEWYRHREPSIFSKRLDTFGHRLLPLLAATAGRSEIDEEIARVTVRLLEYQLMARRENDPIDAENLIAKLEEMIRRKLTGRGRVSESWLKRECHYSRQGIWAWQTAMKNLREAGEIRGESGRVWLHHELHHGPSHV